MDDQLTNTSIEVPIQRIAAIALAVGGLILVAIFLSYQLQIADPYIHDVLSVQGDDVRGHAIFQINCAGCHGLEANGEVGPNLHGVSNRRSDVSLIQQVISGKTPPMPKFQPNTQDMKDLLSYLKTL